MVTEAANNENVSLMDIMNGHLSTYNSVTEAETARAAEIAKKRVIEILKGLTEIERESFFTEKQKKLSKSVTITDQDEDYVRKRTDSMFSDGRKNGSEIIKEEAQKYISAENSKEGIFNFEYANGAGGNLFTVIVTLRKKEGDKK